MVKPTNEKEREDMKATRYLAKLVNSPDGQPDGELMASRSEFRTQGEALKWLDAELARLMWVNKEALNPRTYGKLVFVVSEYAVRIGERMSKALRSGKRV